MTAELDEILRSILPRRVRAARGGKGLTQRQLAKRAALGSATIVTVEGGQMRDLNLSTLHKLCIALGRDPNHLMGYDKESN